MIPFIKQVLSSTSPISSRRSVLLFYALILGSILLISIIILGYVICLSKIDRTSSLQVLKYLIYFNIGILIFILLLTGVITWNNINDTINSVKGLPTGIQQQLTQTVEKTATTVTTQQQ